MKNTTPKKSIADFSKTAIVPTNQLSKIKGGNVIVTEEPIN